MDEELKLALEKLQVKFTESKNLAEKQASDLLVFKSKIDSLEGKLQNNPESDNIKTEIDELKDAMSDLSTRFNKTISTPVMDDDAVKVKVKSVIIKSVGKWVKSSKTGGGSDDLIDYIKSSAVEQFKALNITNAADGGLAVAEVLSRDTIEYAREFSPIVSMVKFMPSLTRNFREMVLIGYPGTQVGIENVAGSVIPETGTQKYIEVTSKDFKINAKPRITDEAMLGTDVDVYGKLVKLLGVQLGVQLATMILYGDGSPKVARGILSSSRVDITDGTGASWKPTLDSNPDNIRPPNFFPAMGTGVTGSLGTDFEAICDFVIDVTNSLPTLYLSGAYWVMNRRTKAAFEKVRDNDGKPIFRHDYINGVTVVTLNGYPVRIDDTYPDIAPDSLFATFGRLDMAYAINNGDVNKTLFDPYSVDGCVVIKADREYFEMIQNSDAIIVCAATANGPA